MIFNEKKLDGLFKSKIKPGGPGACLAVLHNGEVLYKGSFGLTNLENPSPLSSQSVFNTGSLAKMFTAYCLFHLQQQRKLSLEDEVRKHIPELPSYGKPMRLRHLLWHSSGLRCNSTLLWWAGSPQRNNDSRRLALELIFRQKELNFESGSECLYSNSNYLLLSEIIQRISGRSLDALARKLVFEPLGLKQTHFREDATQVIPNLASGHFSRPDGSLGVNRSLGAVPGVGRLMSSLDDLARWDKAFINPSKSALPLLRGMLTQGWLDNGQKIRFGGGMMIQRYRGLSNARQDGFSAGCRSEFCRFPDQGYTFIGLSNHSDLNPTWLLRQAANQVFGRAMEPVSAFGPGQPAAPAPRHKASKARLRELEALYLDVNQGSYVELSATPEGLRLKGRHMDFELKPESDSAFQGLGHAAIYRLDLESDGGFILIKQGRARRFARLRMAAKLPESKLERYVGRYASPELLSRVEFKLKDSKLVMQDANGWEWPMTYLKAGHFFSYFRDFHFTKKGLTMQSGDDWVRRLKWVRL